MRKNKIKRQEMSPEELPAFLRMLKKARLNFDQSIQVFAIVSLLLEGEIIEFYERMEKLHQTLYKKKKCPTKE